LRSCERISVLGVSSDKVEGGSQTVPDVLRAAGFQVNAELERYYAGVGTSYGNENVGNISKTALSSMAIYNDVAVVIFSRTGGESNDCATVLTETEDNMYGSEDMGWRHNALSTDADGKEHKHYLQLTDSEEELLELAKSKCNKVVVLINSSNVMELGNMQNDSEIDAILCVFRPGADGLTGLGNILNGTVSPSAKTVDIYPADLTKDPTWYNYGDGEQWLSSKDDAVSTAFRYIDANGQPVEYVRDNPNTWLIPGVSTGYNFVYYEESIYMGYRYYETAAAEAEAGNYDGFDYSKEVVYPFGYGLSYTTFDWQQVGTLPADWASQQSLTIKVKVTNTGAVAGKDVVQVYAHAPYIPGEVEKAEVSLVGFGKTSTLAPGQSEILEIKVNVQDIASFDDYDKNGNGKSTYELDAGDGYELRLQSDSHTAKVVIALDALANDVILDKDDFSGNTAEALFSGEDIYNMLGWEDGQTLVEAGKMTLMSRADFAGTFPKYTKMEDTIRSSEWFAFHNDYDCFNADTQTLFPEVEDGTSPYPWVKTAADVAGWTQSAG
ncbi:MAG: glycoside hydrolase family 3 C-terminal domain-containing protein, partial [Clostridia bacterium]|nr:glycoside hydrolase family 3 C-terminal domain-containing protein [Clostridia bacterium]